MGRWRLRANKTPPRQPHWTAGEVRESSTATKLEVRRERGGVLCAPDAQGILTRAFTKAMVKILRHLVCVFENSFRGNPDRSDSVILHVTASGGVLFFSKFMDGAIYLDAEL